MGQLPRENTEHWVCMCMRNAMECSETSSNRSFSLDWFDTRSSNPFVWLFWLDEIWKSLLNFFMSEQFLAELFYSEIIEILLHWCWIIHYFSYLGCAMIVSSQFECVSVLSKSQFPNYPLQNVGDGGANNSVFL